MTREMENWITSLNNLGTDVEPPDIQEILNNEHALADPKFAERLAKARTAKVPCDGVLWLT